MLTLDRLNLSMFVVNNFYYVINCSNINRVTIYRTKCTNTVKFYREVLSVTTQREKKS